jgi:hypothetical protein
MQYFSVNNLNFEKVTEFIYHGKISTISNNNNANK